MSSFARRPIQIVEIDIDYCTRTYGSAPCAAVLGTTGDNKCFNGRFGCQDPANFNRGTFTMRFAMNQDGLPKGTIIHPVLRSVSTKAQSVNLSGIDKNKGPLGARAEVVVSIGDFAYSDFEIDKYQADRVSGAAQSSGVGYNPLTSGTFWGKFRARHPYVVGRPLRILEGYVGQDLSAMRTRHYVIHSMAGPSGDGGGVSIKARDVLDLADNDKAVAPAPSNGRLLEDLTSSGPSFSITGDGSEYDASGSVSIGSEIIRYTRSGTTFTVVSRGADGSTASAHNSGDTVQQCVRYQDAAIYDVVYDLLTTYAGVDASFISLTEWETEGDRWQAGFLVTRTIHAPTGVTKLLAQLALFGVYIWWDDVAQKIRFKTNRPLDLGESYIDATDEPDSSLTTPINLLRGSQSVAYDDERRISTVWLWHGQIDATGSEDDRANYAILNTAGAPPDDDKYKEQRFREVFTPWLGNAGDVSIAAPVVTRIFKRYENTPRIFASEIDAKDVAKIDLAELILVYSRVMQGDTGQREGQPMQIIVSEEVIAGHKLRIKAETYTFDQRYGFITENSRSNYAASTDAEKGKGVYIVGGSGIFGDGSSPYVIF